MHQNDSGCVTLSQNKSINYYNTSDAHWKTSRRNLENKMGHHTLPIKGMHPYSITQTYRTRSNTTLAGAPEPRKNMLWQMGSCKPNRSPHDQRDLVVLDTAACNWLRDLQSLIFETFISESGRSSAKVTCRIRRRIIRFFACSPLVKIFIRVNSVLPANSSQKAATLCFAHWVYF